MIAFVVYDASLALRNFFLNGTCLCSTSMKNFSNNSEQVIPGINFSCNLFLDLVWSNYLYAHSVVL